MKHTKRFGKRLFRLAALLCVTALLVSTSAVAAGTKTGSLTLVCSAGAQALSGVTFSLYQAGTVDNSTFALTDEFKASAVKITGLTTSSQWQTAASSLAVYAAANSLKSLQTGSTGTNGQVFFGTLNQGLYLVVGGKLTVGDTTYTFAPFLISVPNTDEAGNTAYDVVAAPKVSSSTTVYEEEEKQNVTALKVWNDGDQEDSRPESITVALLRDGIVYQTAALTADHYWRHTWENLSTKYDWAVIEQNVPSGYSVTYTGSNLVLTITNTYTPDIPDEPPPTGEPPEETEIPDPDTPLIDALPQTGMLWWPVPVMAALGLLLFSIGWLDRFWWHKHED